MAIAASKLGRLIGNCSSEDALVRTLRERLLVRDDASDDDLRAAFTMAQQEHAGLPPGMQEYNTPAERVRVFLGPYLSKKGRRWAVPLDSLRLPDD